MVANAQVKYIRISPTKVRQVIDLIRYKDVVDAKNLLLNLNKRPKENLIKLLAQAVANAKVKGIDPDRLYVSKITADNGAMWKRYKAAAFGRAAPILRRTAHIRIELDVK